MISEHLVSEVHRDLKEAAKKRGFVIYSFTPLVISDARGYKISDNYAEDIIDKCVADISTNGNWRPKTTITNGDA